MNQPRAAISTTPFTAKTVVKRSQTLFKGQKNPSMGIPHKIHCFYRAITRRLSSCKMGEIENNRVHGGTGFSASYTYEMVYGSAPFSIAPRVFNLIPAIETAPNMNPFFPYH